MLYATTRSKTDTYTSYRTLHEDRAQDGGFFLPFKLPKLDADQIASLKKQSFGETVAEILNLFFSAGLSGWDVDCAIGKTASKPIFMNQRVILVQLWNNPEGNYRYIFEKLYSKLVNGECSVPTNWAKIAIRISVLFGIYGQLSSECFDISVASGDFSLPMAAWYARQMGLPIDTIVCACNENSAPWDFIHRGEMNTGVSVVHTLMPELDISNPAELERLIFCALGYEQAAKYVEVSSRKGLYQIRPDMAKSINQGMFVSVVGKERIETVINSVYRTNQYILDAITAVAYGGLQDYRAKTGESNPTVLLCDRIPVQDYPIVNHATGLNQEEIEKIINQ